MSPSGEIAHRPSARAGGGPDVALTSTPPPACSSISVNAARKAASSRSSRLPLATISASEAASAARTGEWRTQGRDAPPMGGERPTYATDGTRRSAAARSC